MPKSKTTLAAALEKTAAPVPPAKTPTKEPRTRTNTKLIAGHFDAVVSKQLRAIALEEDTTVQQLLREAINDLFSKRGKSTLA